MESSIIVFAINTLTRVWPWALPVIVLIAVEALLIRKIKDPNSALGRKILHLLTGIDDTSISNDISLMHRDSENKSAMLELLDEVACNIRYLCEILNNKPLLESKLDDTFSLVFEVTSFLSHTKTGRARISVWKQDPENPGRLIIYKHEGFSIDYFESAELSYPNSIAGFVLQNGRSYNCPNINEDPLFERKNGNHSYSSLLCVPVKLRRKAVAVLCIDAVNPRAFTKDDERYLQYCANRIGVLLALEEFAREEENRSGDEKA